MRILVATPIYPPEIGGPAIYSAALVEALQKQGHIARVVLYGPLRGFPSGIRHLLYTIKLLWASFSADAVISFDAYTVGLPAAIVHLFTRKPLIVRIGGDFVWEIYVERTKDLVPLPEFYGKRVDLSWKEQVAFTTVRWVLKHARVVFSSEWQQAIWKEAYQLDPERTHVVENAIEPRLESFKPLKKNFLFFTRDIALKNADAFRRAFAQAKEKHPEIELEEGHVPHAELLEKIQHCYAVVLPSISDITPNYILDAIRCGKPILMTKYSGYADLFKHFGSIVDPLDEGDMIKGIEYLADDIEYVVLKNKISKFTRIHTYDEIAQEFIELLK